jgi:hypothetical protein
VAPDLIDMPLIRVQLHGLLGVVADNPGGWVDLALPEGADVMSAMEMLSERSPLVDPRACMALVDKTKVPLNHVLRAGEELHLYHLFSGG